MEYATGTRWDVIVRLLESAESVVDIGCRDRALHAYLPQHVRYVGLDLVPPADVIASAEKPLPFDDDAFEVAVLADVLEHLNDPHAALREATRVASAGVIVLLPNLFFYKQRLMILAGKLGTDKYDMGQPEAAVDRHRWFVHFDQARAFVAAVAASAGWTVTVERAYDGGPARPVARAAMFVLRRISRPSLWAYEYAARISPTA